MSPLPTQPHNKCAWKRIGRKQNHTEFLLLLKKNILHDKLSTALVSLDAVGHGHSVFIYTVIITT